jgi:hypothetical protein
MKRMYICEADVHALNELTPAGRMPVMVAVAPQHHVAMTHEYVSMQAVQSLINWLTLAAYNADYRGDWDLATSCRAAIADFEAQK